MRRFFYGAVLVCAAGVGATAAERSTVFDKKITELCRLHNVPERLVHRVIMRESRYVPRALSRGNYGLMQIRYGTARSMGYRGTPDGLLDGSTNLTYAVPYLANAYAVAGGNEDRAVRLYASGFYYVAKRQGALGRMQIAQEPADMVAYAAPPANPIAALFGAATAPAVVAVAAAQAESSAARAQMVADMQAIASDDDADDVAPLPPRRPKAFSTRRFIKLARAASEREDDVADLRTASAR